jgi:hypothetical protein
MEVSSYSCTRRTLHKYSEKFWNGSIGIDNCITGPQRNYIFSNVSVSTRMILCISYCQRYSCLSVWYVAVPAERNSKLTLAQRHSTCSQGFERCMNAPWPYSEQDVCVMFPTSSLCGLYFVHINFLSVKINFNKGMLKYIWSCHSWDLQYRQKKSAPHLVTIKKFNFNKQTRPFACPSHAT